MCRWAVVLAMILAGCAGGGNAPAEPPADPYGGLGLEATSDTGVIRGIVVDASIKPVADVQVSIVGRPDQTFTNQEGQFGFDQLRSGSYVLNATKTGYVAQEIRVSVEAGDMEPTPVKLVLPLSTSELPHITTYQWTAYIGCGIGTPVEGYGPMVCNIVHGATNEAQHELDRVPQFVVTEMVWEPASAAAEELELSHRGKDGVFVEKDGPSPLLIQADEVLLTSRLADGPLLITDVFIPTDEIQVVLEQETEVFTNVFYGFVPESGWSFVRNGPHPLPP